uniref:PDZ domain-containing protein n=1 Tax=Amorphochlora amoebiformis TaxID=1561963 RepID=A0A7S0D1N3_9EUKA|mmetsp:Transcript_1628/g.2311  ORF Transcript_1628/g.2311 Transcript_1628/m.2311 type:complete len:657 (+) Transcript_1628:64-2034(+)
MGISISFENDTNKILQVSIQIRGSRISVGSAVIKPKDTYTKTDKGISASMTYNAIIEDLTSPMIFTGSKYETPKWYCQVQAPSMKGEKRYLLSELTSQPPPSEKRLSAARRSSGGEGGSNKDKFEEMELKHMLYVKAVGEYWGEQGLGLSALANRAASAQETYKAFAGAVAGDINHYKQMASGFEKVGNLGNSEYGTVKDFCNEYVNMRKLDAKETRSHAEGLIKQHQALLSHADQMGKFKNTVGIPVKALKEKINQSRQTCLKHFTKYRQVKDVEAKGTKLPEEPFLCLLKYQQAANGLDREEAGYLPAINEAARSMKDADAKRIRHLQTAIATMLQAEKTYHLQRIQRIEALLKASESINAEADYKMFSSELNWVGAGDPSKVKEIKFQPTELGLVFINRVVTEVKSGSQAEKLGVVPGWHMLQIDGKTTPPTHRQTEVILAQLKKSGRTISIKFGKTLNESDPFYRQPPPTRDAKLMQTLLDNEVAYKGNISVKSGIMGNWMECTGVISTTGKLHVFKKNLLEQVHVSISLVDSEMEVKSAQSGEILLKETQAGIFGSKLVKHCIKVDNPSEWLRQANPFLVRAQGADYQPPLPSSSPLRTRVPPANPGALRARVPPANPGPIPGASPDNDTAPLRSPPQPAQNGTDVQDPNL